jgi:hypothetical protein
VEASAVASGADAKLRAELILHPLAGADHSIGTIDSTPLAGGFHLVPWIQGNICGEIPMTAAGEGLILRFANTGSSDFSVLETKLTIP